MTKKRPKLPLIEEMDRTSALFRSLGMNDTMISAAELSSRLHESISESVRKTAAEVFHTGRGFDAFKLADRTAELDKLTAATSFGSRYADSLAASFRESTAMSFASEAMQSDRDLHDLIKPQFDALSFAQKYAQDTSTFTRFVEETQLAHQEMLNSVHTTAAQLAYQDTMALAHEAALDAFDRALGVDAFSEVARVREMLEVHDWREEALATAQYMETTEQRAAEFEIDQAATYITDHVRRAVLAADENLPTDQAPQQVGVEYLAQMVASLQQSIADMKETPLSKIGYMIVGAVISTVISLIMTAMLAGSFQPTQPPPRQDHRGRLKAVKASLREQNDDLKPIRVVKVKTGLRVHQTPSPSSRVLHRLPPLAAVVVKDTRGKMALILHRNPLTDEIIAGWVAKKHLAKISR